MPPESNGTSNYAGNAKLSAMLRECANFVARNEFDPVILQTLVELRDYAARQTPPPAASPSQSRPTNSTTTRTSAPSSNQHHHVSKESANDAQNKRIPFGLGKKFSKLTQPLTQQQPPPPSQRQQQQQPPSQRQPQPPPPPQPQQPQRQVTPPTATATPAPTPSATQQPHHGPSQTHNYEAEWCQEHFTMGCACKARRLSDNNSTHATETKQPLTASVASAATATASTSAAAGASTTTSTSTTLTQNRSSSPRIMSRPPFQRPVNPNSTLIANGWIEQQRRSKMRVVWKDILASLVEGRKPGEETTLWIQREVTNPTTGKKELEALHQIPMKWLEDVQYLDYSVDQRFSIRVYNVAEEFLFRCHDEEAAQNWVMTLLSAKEMSLKGTTGAAAGAALPQAHRPTTSNGSIDKTNLDWDRTRPAGPKVPTAKSWPEDEASHQQQTASEPIPTHRMTVKELRAIAHGAGINTVGMERGELEAAVARISLGAATTTTTTTPAAHVPTVDPTVAGAAAEEVRRRQLFEEQKKREAEEGARRLREAEELARREAEELQRQRELEERRRLEEEERKKVAEEERRRIAAAVAAEEERRRAAAAAAAAAVEEEERRRMEEEEERRRLVEEEEIKQRRLAEERRLAAEEEQRRRLAAEEELRRRQAAEEEQRRRLAAEEEQRRRLAEEEQRRRLAEEEFRRRQAAEEEQRRRMAEDEQRRRIAEQQAAELRRRQEEAQRQQQWQQQQWQQQQWQQQQQQQKQQQQQPQPGQHPPWQQPHPQQAGWPPHGPPPTQAQWQQHQAYQQQQQQQGRPPAPPGAVPHGQPHAAAGQPPPPPQQQQQAPASPVNMKYAKMAQQTEGDNEQAAIARVKHELLLRWALQPPTMQTLRPIDVLVTSIHSVFPPALGVAGHEYFTRWKPVTPSDIGAGVGTTADSEKLTKIIKKIRFFLHPDKLPRDLNSEQQFMCKMLWDVTSDAWEEFQKRNEELDWIRT